MTKRKIRNSVQLNRRVWLNPPGYVKHNASVGGAILTSVQATAGGDYADASLHIKDCSDTIRLDVSVASPKSRKRTLKKIQLLISELENFYGAIEAIDLVME